MTGEARPREMEPEEIARMRLEVLRREHRDLDAAIRALEETGGDRFTIQRFKKQKLALRDRIAVLEDQITPDIIA